MLDEELLPAEDLEKGRLGLGQTLEDSVFIFVFYQKTLKVEREGMYGGCGYACFTDS